MIIGDKMDYKVEVEKRVQWITEVLNKAHASGIVLGNSGGKDCTLVEILSKMATPNVLSVIMPCESKQNYGSDRDDALLIAKEYDIPTIEIDVTECKKALRNVLGEHINNDIPMAYHNINPRLRMTVIYALAQSKNYLVAGTGNASETYMGYFTKWGDGAYDFNPIIDLCVEDVYGMLRYLNCPANIVDKKPSAGLYEGQTDEIDMGVTYPEIDAYIKTGQSDNSDKIARAHSVTEHKRVLPMRYGK